MSVVKFKDILLDERSNLSEDKIILFNNELKGKYAYIVNWLYIISIDRIGSFEKYIKMCQNISEFEIEYKDKYLLYTEIPENIYDINEINSINNVDKYRTLNRYTTDSNITIDELRKFRPWLAHTLLLQDIQDCDVKHMLEYYSFDDGNTLEGSGMYDCVIKQLSIFGNTKIIFNNSYFEQNNCGCSNKNINNNYSNISSLNNKCSCGELNNFDFLNSNTFDIVKVYKMNLYIKMVDTFKNLEFWTPFANSIVVDMKNYIDNIIKVNLPLTSQQPQSNYIDCSNLNVKEVEQQNNMRILINLSQALQYIIDNDIKTHRNFINDSLFKWASNLYEKMYWMNTINIPSARSCGNSSIFMYVKDGDVYIKGIDEYNKRYDYKILRDRHVAEPLTDASVVTGEFLESYISKNGASCECEDLHDWQVIGSTTNKIERLN
jgi:hypothetical protein